MARLAPVLDEIDYAWDDAPAAADAMLAWLAGELAAGATADRMPEAGVSCSMPRSRPRWAARRCVARCRDRRSARCADAFAWWERGPGRRRALARTAGDVARVPWREPIDKAERGLMKSVDADLRAAHEADGELALPWAEWPSWPSTWARRSRADELRGTARPGRRRSATGGTAWTSISATAGRGAAGRVRRCVGGRRRALLGHRRRLA